MRRREFIAIFAGIAGVWPLAARALPAPRLGYVWIGTKGTDGSVAGLRQGLADRGYVVGRNLVLEERYADANT
jgi:putative ABC transport system substrate-binding protein